MNLAFKQNIFEDDLSKIIHNYLRKKVVSTLYVMYENLHSLIYRALYVVLQL